MNCGRWRTAGSAGIKNGRTEEALNDDILPRFSNHGVEAKYSLCRCNCNSQCFASRRTSNVAFSVAILAALLILIFQRECSFSAEIIIRLDINLLGGAFLF